MTKSIRKRSKFKVGNTSSRMSKQSGKDTLCHLPFMAFKYLINRYSKMNLLPEILKGYSVN